MKDQNIAALESAMSAQAIDVGRPVQWMVDPTQRDVILGVTYAFSQSGERKTVWYTPNKRKPKNFVTVSDPPKG